MAHFAELSESNIVIRVLVVPDEQELRGQEHLADDVGLGGTWLQCSYNSNFRGCFPAEGYTYDSESDSFYEPTPFPSWVLNTSEVPHYWESPLGGRENDHQGWDEENQQWVDGPMPSTKPEEYPSFVWNPEAGTYQPPVPWPEGGTYWTHRWDEDTTSWVEVE